MKFNITLQFVCIQFNGEIKQHEDVHQKRLKCLHDIVV